VLLVFTWLVVQGNCQDSDFVKTSLELTSVPLNIPDPTHKTFIDLGKNPNHPDFSNKFPILSTLFLQNNWITAIDCGCFRGTVISKICPSFNQLTAFPDFFAIRNTLARIFLYDNQIHRVTSNDGLSQLNWLSLMNNSLVMKADHFILLDGFQWLTLSNAQLMCCKDTAWLKRPNLGFLF
jgi:Leucine-rich repeat (LRR) protein